MEKTVEENYQEFWKEIIEKDGIIDIEQIKKELYDFSTIIRNISIVYDHVTGGAISKPLTLPEIVIAIADEHYQELYTDER